MKHELLLDITRHMPCKTIAPSAYDSGKTRKPITRESMAKLISYNPKTGKFVWGRRESESFNKTHAGKVAGYIDWDGYRVITMDRGIYMAHRLAFLWMTGAFPSGQVDHINHIRDDNRWQNLRVVSHKENARNAALPRDNKSGVCGVGWHLETGKWRAYITENRKQIYLGLHEDFFEAVCARKSAENRLGYLENHGLPKGATYRYKTPSGRSAV